MESEKINFLTEKFSKNVESVNIHSLQKRLQETDDEYFKKFEALNFKSIKKAKLLSFFGFLGVDRFYLNDVKTGIFKLAYFLILILCYCFVPVNVSDGIILFMVVIIPFSVVYVFFYFHDIFTISSKVKFYNLSKIQAVLYNIKHKKS